MISIVSAHLNLRAKDVTTDFIAIRILAKMVEYAKKAPMDLFANVEVSQETIALLTLMSVLGKILVITEALASTP